MNFKFKRKSMVFILTVILTTITTVTVPASYRWGKASVWAPAALRQVSDNGLFPEIFNGADLTKPITRIEFAHIAVKLFEKLYGEEAPLASSETFADTKDPMVLKAYFLNIVECTGGTFYAPNQVLSREEMVDMLSRVFKKLFWEGWSLGDESNFTENYTKHFFDTSGVRPLQDDEIISGFAKNAVYFMLKQGIISGVGDNTFAPHELASVEATLIVSNKIYEFIESGKIPALTKNNFLRY